MDLVNTEEAYAAYDHWNLAALKPGTVLSFWVGDRMFAALFIDDRWFVTGRESPNGAPMEDFVAWLIGRGVWPYDIEKLVPG
jgi:hypothetical protein